MKRNDVFLPGRVRDIINPSFYSSGWWFKGCDSYVNITHLICSFPPSVGAVGDRKLFDIKSKILCKRIIFALNHRGLNNSIFLTVKIVKKMFVNIIITYEYAIVYNIPNGYFWKFKQKGLIFSRLFVTNYFFKWFYK